MIVFPWERDREGNLLKGNHLSIGRGGLFGDFLSPGWTIVEASFRPKNRQLLWAEPTLSSGRADHVAVFLSVSHSDCADLKVCIYIFTLLYHLSLYWLFQLQLRSKWKEIIIFEYSFSSRFKNLNWNLRCVPTPPQLGLRPDTSFPWSLHITPFRHHCSSLSK